MKFRNGLRLGFAALTLAATAPALGAAAPNVVSEAGRTVSGGRAVRVMVAQSEIKSDINPSNIAVATGGGLLGGMMAASQNASRAKKAEAAITPLRDALANFDGDALAIETTKAALNGVAWMHPAEHAFSKDSSILGKSAALDSSPAAQLAFIEYSYDVSPDFGDVRVVAKIEFANKVNPAANPAKPETRVLPKHLAYAQSITVIVSLPERSPDMSVNVASWSADGAKPARNALQQAFARVAELLPRTLALTLADVAAMKGKDKAKGTAGGFAGRIQDMSSDGTLIWANGFIRAQTLR